MERPHEQPTLAFSFYSLIDPMEIRIGILVLMFILPPAMADESDTDACADGGVRQPEYVIGEGDEPHRLRVCYNWGCSEHGFLSLDQEDIQPLDRLFHNPDCGAGSAGLELQMIRVAIKYLETKAGEQLPIGNDLSGNHRDRHIEGRADCVDNATNTNNYLHFLRDQGYLKYWRSPQDRPIEKTCVLCPWVPQHFAAAISPEGRDEIRYVVDSWLLDNGALPFVGPIETWRKRFIFEDKHRLNPYLRAKDIRRFCKGESASDGRLQDAVRNLPGLSPAKQSSLP